MNATACQYAEPQYRRLPASAGVWVISIITALTSWPVEIVTPCYPRQPPDRLSPLAERNPPTWPALALFVCESRKRLLHVSIAPLDFSSQHRLRAPPRRPGLQLDIRPSTLSKLLQTKSERQLPPRRKLPTKTAWRLPQDTPAGLPELDGRPICSPPALRIWGSLTLAF